MNYPSIAEFQCKIVDREDCIEQKKISRKKIRIANFPTLVLFLILKAKILQTRLQFFAVFSSSFCATCQSKNELGSAPLRPAWLGEAPK
jgi:hypothetical protein